MRSVKIGEIARKFDLSEQTIRYYVKKGLLIPSHSSYQYSFSERDEEDLALITTYKLLGFSLSEILNILSLYRISHVKAPKEAYQLLRIFQKKLDDLQETRQELDSSINRLNGMISEIKSQFLSTRTERGIHVSFLDILACPDCCGELILSDATIINSQIISGQLQCSCGRLFSIRGGILYDDGLPSMFSNTFFEEQTTLLEDYDPHTIVEVKEDERQLLTQILAGPTPASQTVLESNFRTWFFLLKNIDALRNAGNRYIFAEQYPEVVQYYKAVFDTFDYPHKYMFMACRPECYPIRRHTLDMWIDYMDCIDYSETESRFLPELIHPYLRENAYVHGVTFVSKDTLYFQKLRKLHPELPDNLHSYFYQGNFQIMLKNSGYQMISTKFLREIRKSSVQNGMDVTQSPPYRMLYLAKTVP